MELTEDQIFKKMGKKCRICNRNTILPYAYEWICLACNYNVKKAKKRTN